MSGIACEDDYFPTLHLQCLPREVNGVGLEGPVVVQITSHLGGAQMFSNSYQGSSIAASVRRSRLCGRRVGHPPPHFRGRHQFIPQIPLPLVAFNGHPALGPGGQKVVLCLGRELGDIAKKWQRTCLVVALPCLACDDGGVKFLVQDDADSMGTRPG